MHQLTRSQRLSQQNELDELAVQEPGQRQCTCVWGGVGEGVCVSVVVSVGVCACACVCMHACACAHTCLCVEPCIIVRLCVWVCTCVLSVCVASHVTWSMSIYIYPHGLCVLDVRICMHVGEGVVCAHQHLGC